MKQLLFGLCMLEGMQCGSSSANDLLVPVVHNEYTCPQIQTASLGLQTN